MGDFLNRDWFFISIFVGIIFLAFSAMIQSWMLAITTLIFIAVEYVVAKFQEQKNAAEAQRSIEEFQQGGSMDEGGAVKIKIPIDFIVLAIFAVVAFIELIIVVFLSY